MTFERTFYYSTGVTCLLLAFLLSFIVSQSINHLVFHEISESSCEILKTKTSLFQINPDSEDINSIERLFELSGLNNLYHLRVYNIQGKLLWTGPQKLSSPSVGNDPDVSDSLRGERVIHKISQKEISNQGLTQIPAYNVKIVVPVMSPTHALSGVAVAYLDLGAIHKDIRFIQLLVLSITLGTFVILFFILRTGVSRISKEMMTQSENLRKTAEQMEFSYRESLQILANAIESRAPHTAGHSQRVALYATEVAKRLNLKHEQIEKVRYTCLLQNVGLVRISDSILQKSGKLEAEELEKLRRHPVDGAELLKRSPTMAELALAVKAHHERFDGTGYPEGLVGEQIPLEARIVAVADAYVAMTTDRPYRKALTREQAIAELRKHSGTQFDLKVVDMVIQVVHESPERRSGTDRRIKDWGSPDGQEKRKPSNRRQP